MNDRFKPDHFSSSRKITIQTIEPIIIGPFRFIKPYPFTFKCSAKKRWWGRKLIDVFTQEFKHWSRETLAERMRDGYLVVNNKRIDENYVVKEHDVITHSIFRHESPIFNIPIEKLGETSEFVAFLKPGSIPVHATGGYFYNSMVKLLDKRYYPVHRLDRVTSGIIVMAKSENAARNFGKLLEENKINKSYIARVAGVFPEGETRVDAPIRESARDRAVHECGEGGKDCLTIFHRLKTNGVESIVECHPITGRTHQIRVHLSHLGHPISNDNTYGGRMPQLTNEEKLAIQEAEKQGLWPPDTILEQNEVLTFAIWLHSYHYQSNDFDFTSPLPDWANLPETSWYQRIISNCNVF